MSSDAFSAPSSRARDSADGRSNLLDVVTRCHLEMGIPLDTCVDFVSANPAAALRLSGVKGVIANGASQVAHYIPHLCLIDSFRQERMQIYCF